MKIKENKSYVLLLGIGLAIILFGLTLLILIICGVFK